MPTKIDNKLTSDQFQIDHNGNLVIHNDEITELVQNQSKQAPPPERAGGAQITVWG